jgi:hypothetical protein
MSLRWEGSVGTMLFVPRRERYGLGMAVRVMGGTPWMWRGSGGVVLWEVVLMGEGRPVPLGVARACLVSIGLVSDGPV